MATPNGLNPSFVGNVKALSFSTPIGYNGSFGGNSMSKFIGTSGTNKVEVFGTTTGFSGTLLAVKILSGDDANGTVDVVGNDGTVCRIAKGSAGAAAGSYLRIGGLAGTAFGSSGSFKVSMNSTAAALVELIFVSKEVEG